MRTTGGSGNNLQSVRSVYETLVAGKRCRVSVRRNWSSNSIVTTDRQRETSVRRECGTDGWTSGNDRNSNTCSVCIRGLTWSQRVATIMSLLYSTREKYTCTDRCKRQGSAAMLLSLIRNDDEERVGDSRAYVCNWSWIKLSKDNSRRRSSLYRCYVYFCLFRFSLIAIRSLTIYDRSRISLISIGILEISVLCNKIRGR